MFTSLRKPQPEEEPAEPLEDQDAPEETEDQEQQDAEQEGESGEVPGFLPALATGVRGWFTWCSSRIGVSGTYTIHIVALWAMGHYSVWVVWGVSLAFALAVVAFMPRPTLDRLTERLERPGKKTSGKGGETLSEEAPADPLVTVLWSLIADAPGVHLKTLTQTLAQACEKAGRPAPDKAAVQASLEARGITLRPSVRDAQDKVNKGVHREDLKAWQNTPPPPATPAPAPDA